jgi:hypothetical protein
MKKLGLKATQGSGSGWLEKEDGYNDTLLAQLKTTDANSYKFELLDWNKLENHANMSKLIPFFITYFIGNDQIFITCKVQDLRKVLDGLDQDNLGDAEIEDDWLDILD